MTPPTRPSVRGRPGVGPSPTNVCVRVPGRVYDTAYALAKQRGITVPALVRESLSRELARRTDDDDDADD